MSAHVFRPGSSGIDIVAMGGQASIGLTLPAISAAWRGRLNGFREAEHFRAYWSADPYTLATLASLPNDLESPGRMKQMGKDAMGEALAVLNECSWKTPPLPVLLAVPSPRPGWSVDAGRQLAKDLIATLPHDIDRQYTSVIGSGQEGGLTALGSAVDLISKRLTPWCLVGGVESCFDLEFLRWMEEQKRLKNGDQPNGVIPGEGAGVLLLADSRWRQEHNLPGLARVIAASRGEEPQPWYTFKPSQAKGLTAVLQALLTDETPKADETWADLNGESWRADEWVMAYLRTGQRHGEPLVIHHPAQAWGDIGAASGPLLTALCISEFQRGRTPARTSLIWTASATQPFRSACLLQRIETENAS